MNVSGINANIKTNFQPSSFTNKQKALLEQQPDNYSFSSNTCNEDIKRSTIRGKGLFAPVLGYSYSGNINNKNAYFEESQKTAPGLFAKNQPEDITGTIDDKEIVLTKTKNRISLTESVINHKGTYAGNDFDLEFKPGSFLAESTLKGTINGEEVEFSFPGSKVPTDDTTKDIITSILMLNGFKANSKGGEFKKLANSDWQQKIQDQQMMDCIAAQQMGMI